MKNEVNNTHVPYGVSLSLHWSDVMQPSKHASQESHGLQKVLRFKGVQIMNGLDKAARTHFLEGKPLVQHIIPPSQYD